MPIQTLDRLGTSREISLRTRLYAQGLLDLWVADLEGTVELTDDESDKLETLTSILGSPLSDRDKARTLERFQEGN